MAVSKKIFKIFKIFKGTAWAVPFLCAAKSVENHKVLEIDRIRVE